MDPQATLKRLADAIAAQHWSDAVLAVNDYWLWRIKGGFQPSGGDARAELLASRLADALE